jgi:hypothetical protein
MRGVAPMPQANVPASIDAFSAAAAAIVNSQLN